MTQPTMTAPAMPIGLRQRAGSDEPPPLGQRPPGCLRRSLIVMDADPRVEQAVEDVDDEVDDRRTTAAMSSVAAWITG